MTNPISPLKSIDKLAKDILDILETAEKIQGFNKKELRQFEKETRKIPRLVKEGVLKIAVVGVIKSGKSTLVNSLIGKDLVQRGAGVVTSITTRIRKGRKNQACLYFKSWDDINFQLQNVLELFPAKAGEEFSSHRFDMRRTKDRAYLEQAYQELSQEFPITRDEIRTETLLMKYALNGFEFCKDLVKADETTLCFSVNQFDTHKEFTSDPAKAFYVRDVCLDVYGKAVEQGIEIADCQGADSTDPAQLFQVMRYLESANFIIYCISSRTGLRQADIMFLERIKRLGRLNNVIFVNNCDLSEHENLDDLIKIENGIRESLGFLNISPEIFSFSALFNLFFVMSPRLKKRDIGRLELWNQEKKLVQYCDENTQKFNAVFKHRIEKDTQHLLISNHLRRLEMILNEIEDRAKAGFEILSSGEPERAYARHSLENLFQNAVRLEKIVANSVDGAVKGLRDEISSILHEIFDQDDGKILKRTSDFLNDLTVDIEKYRPSVNETGFNKILYLLFQDVRRQLELYVIEVVRPELKGLIEEIEQKIKSYFHSLLHSYQVELASEGGTESADPGSGSTGQDTRESIDVDNIKKILGLEIPERIFKAEYTPKLKMNIFADFGVHSILQIVKALFNRENPVSFSPALHRTVSTIKKGTERALKSQFSECRGNIESGYITPLIDACERDFKEKIQQRFQRYRTYKKEMEDLFLLELSEKAAQREKVSDLRNRISKAQKVLRSIEDSG